MGFVDRGGGREAKGSSLRRSKKNPGAASTRNKDAHKNYATVTVRTLPTPPLAMHATMKAWVASLLSAQQAAAPDESTSETYSAAVDTFLELAKSLPTSAATHSFVDGAVALLSRKLEADQVGILRRAKEDGRLAAAVCWCPEVERQALLVETCKQHNQMAVEDRTARRQKNAAQSKKAGGAKRVHFATEETSPELGLVKTTEAKETKDTAADDALDEDNACLLYCVVGVHVNNIVRTNAKLQQQWLDDISEKAKHGEVVGILSGLNLERPPGTHHAQELFLRDMWKIAAEEKLPLILHAYAADDEAANAQTADRLAEILTDLYANHCLVEGKCVAPVAVVLYNGLRLLSHSSALRSLVKAQRPVTNSGATFPFGSRGPGLFVMVSADGLTASAEGSEKVCVVEPGIVSLLPPLTGLDAMASADVSPTQILISTGAPWSTPQNMDDPYVCSMPNEPGNFLFTVKAIYDAMASRTDGTAGDARLSLDAFLSMTLLNAARVFFADCLKQDLAIAAKRSNKTATERHAKTAHDAKEEEEAAGEEDENTDDDDGEEDSAEDEDDESSEDGEGDVRAPRMHVPTGVALVDAPAPPIVPEDDSLEALLRQAAAERERLEKEAEAEEEAARLRGDDDAGKKKKEKKKNVKKNNRSNFSTFRNKDFAARTAKREAHPNQEDSEDDEADQLARAGDDAMSGGQSSSDSDAGEAPQHTDKPRSKNQSGKKGAHVDPEEAATTSAKKPRAAAAKPADNDGDGDDDSEDENGPVTTMAPRKARKKKNKKLQKQMAQYQHEVDGAGSSRSSSSSSGSSEGVARLKPQTGKKGGRGAAAKPAASESDDEPVSTMAPPKQRKKKNKKP